MLLTTFDPFLTDFDRMVQRTFGRGDWPAGRSVLPMDVIRRDDQVELRPTCRAPTRTVSRSRPTVAC